MFDVQTLTQAASIAPAARPRIAYVITHLREYGGAAIHLRDLCAGFVARGWDVFVLTGEEGPPAVEIAGLGVRIERIDSLRRSIHPVRDLRAFRELREALRRIAPDLVSCHTAKAGLLGRLAACSLGLPVTFTVHGWTFTDGIPARRAAIYRLLERATDWIAPASIIAVSEADRRIGIQAGIGRGRISTVHNGAADIDPSSAVVAIPDPDGSVTMTMVARFAPQKDHATLLRALALLDGQEGLPAWRLKLAGNGDDQAMRGLAEDLGIADRVAFLGERQDIPEILAGTDIFLLASNWEGFPYATVEAMRAALPVVVSDVGGAAEAVLDGETGFLVPRGDAAVLSDRIRRLLIDEVARRRMGRSGRARFVAEFSVQAMLDRTAAVYDSCLRDRS